MNKEIIQSLIETQKILIERIASLERNVLNLNAAGNVDAQDQNNKAFAEKYPDYSFEKNQEKLEKLYKDIEEQLEKE